MDRVFIYRDDSSVFSIERPVTGKPGRRSAPAQ